MREGWKEGRNMDVWFTGWRERKERDREENGNANI